MNKKPDFSELFFSKTKDFLDIFLTKQEKLSPDTVKAYRISLTCFYTYVTEEKKVKVMQFCFSDCTYEFILTYSLYLQESKKLSNSTVNQRLAALKSYLKYAADGNIALMQVYMGIQNVPLLRLPKLQRPIIEKDALKLFLDKPLDTYKGNRDRMLLILLFDSAVRVSEILNITLGDISLNVSSPTILIHGKGKKQRIISVNGKTSEHLQEYIRNYHQKDAAPDTPLFYTIIHGSMNHMSERNIERIVKKYGDQVRKNNLEIPEKIYPHMLRRTRASGLY